MASRKSKPSHDGAPESEVLRIYQSLRQSIIDGRYEAGTPLRLQRLAEELGVSFIPVREAMRLLEKERLVRVVPNQGARVAELSLNDLVDAYQTRIALEADALRRAFPHLDAELLAEIGQTKDKMVRAFESGDDDTAFALHREVHFSLYERSESPWLLHLIEILWSHTERYRRIATRLHDTYEEVGDEHASILEALKGGELEEAVAALRRDLEHTAELIQASQERANVHGGPKAASDV